TRPLEARRSYSGQGVGDERRDDRPAFKSSASGDTRQETTSRGTRNPAPRAGSDVRGLARTATGQPCARLLQAESLSEPIKRKLREVEIALDPLQLLEEVRVMQSHL